MNVLINYADKGFKSAQDLNLKTGRDIAGFNQTWAYTREDIDSQFYEENKEILDQPRGAGYWLWKERLFCNLKYGFDFGIVQRFKTNAVMLNLLFVTNALTEI